ncbi:MAG: ATP--guanido phosphotransferase [Oscillospiraceae bacterium]|jgi:protein arginine kinase|nr:ATP--guanido phosphotransferase [Oscillospiraceae bacterium]
MIKWYESSGKDIDVAMSAKVNFSRNLSGYVFTNRLDQKSKEEITKKVKKVIDNNIMDIGLKHIEMNKLNHDEVISFAEKGLISPEFVSVENGGSLFLTDDEGISIVMFEDEHVKIQTFTSGLEALKALETADKIDNILDNELNFAFDKNLGYLTQCPTNIGTAMKASVILHLPALCAAGQIPKLSSNVSRLGLFITNVYGDSVSPKGGFYQLCNHVTMGLSEKSAIQNLTSIAEQIVDQERSAREDIFTDLKFQDSLWRSCGVLKNARILSFDEFIQNIANIRIGASKNMPGIEMETINKLIKTVHPATINTSKGKRLNRQDRDIIRAEQTREVFSKI